MFAWTGAAVAAAAVAFARAFLAFASTTALALEPPVCACVNKQRQLNVLIKITQRITSCTHKYTRTHTTHTYHRETHQYLLHYSLRVNGGIE